MSKIITASKMNMKYHTLSIKGTTTTKDNLQNIFNNAIFFKKLEKSGVMLNNSWFFKFSSSIFLKNIDNATMFDSIENLNEFAYNCHYVNHYDNNLLDFLNQY